MADKPLGQAYHDEVEALKAGGMSNADAIRATAAKHGKTENAVRGGIHQYKSRHGGSSSAASGRGGRRTRTVSVDSAVAQARKALEQALELIDREVDRAARELKAAQDRFESATTSVRERKTEIERKLKALS
jgi:hypothetical protein